METALAILKIIVADILLSGDNAVVIALACRNLPPRYMKRGLFFGAGAAIALRVIFVFVVDLLFHVPGLKLAGGLLLGWIALKLVLQKDDDGDNEVRAGDNLLSAIKIIVIADAVMSLDNVVAIAAAATDPATGEVHRGLVVFGLLLSMPIILFASTLVMRLLTRFPALVLVGGALLGWVAGEVAMGDSLITDELDPTLSWPGMLARVVGAAGVVGAYVWMLFTRRESEPREAVPDEGEVRAPPMPDEDGEKK